MKNQFVKLAGCLLLAAPMYSADLLAEEATQPQQPQGQGQMGGMQHPMGGGMMGQGQGGMMGQGQGGMMGQGGMGGMGGMMGMMTPMTPEQREELAKKTQDQDLKLNELRLRIRDAKNTEEQERLKTEHRQLLREYVQNVHKMMMQDHMQMMQGQGQMQGQKPPAGGAGAMQH